MDKHDRRCQNCTKPLPEDARVNRRYCDENCRRQAYGQPALVGGMQCESCGQPLPETSRKNKRFCGAACQKAAARRRVHPGRETLRAQLAFVSSQLTRTRTALGQSRGRVHDREMELAALRVQLAAERRKKPTALIGQANRAAGVRTQLAASNRQLSALRRNWSATAEEQVATAEMTGLRQQLATLQKKHGQLSDQYAELAAAADLAATERRQLQVVVRQWDTLCKRLHKATGGQPAAAVDKDVLATWLRFRQVVATPSGNRGRTPLSTPATTGSVR